MQGTRKLKIPSSTFFQYPSQFQLQFIQDSYQDPSKVSSPRFLQIAFAELSEFLTIFSKSPSKIQSFQVSYQFQVNSKFIVGSFTDYTILSFIRIEVPIIPFKFL